MLNLTASESDGLIDVEFTNATTSVTPSVPEPSTWVMMALGFGALGYAGFRRRTACFRHKVPGFCRPIEKGRLPGGLCSYPR
jgi:hypothetical protein